MIKHTGVWVAIALLSVAAACVPNDTKPVSEQALAETKLPSSGAATNLAPVSVLIAHRVADYDAWKRVFDGHQQARMDASCFGHYLKKGIDGSDMVYVFCPASDVDRLRAFLDSADLAAAMKNAGVEGPPEITVMKPMSRNLVPEQKLPGIVVMHPVKDYDAWRKAYDELEEFRRQSGIIGHAVSQKLGSPNDVIVYHQAHDVADLRAFVDSAELEQAMQRAGVVGEPDIRFIQVVDFARY